jgi:hypothetical protein
MRRRASDRSIDEEAVWRRNDGSNAAGMSEDHRACLMVGRLAAAPRPHTLFPRAQPPRIAGSPSLIAEAHSRGRASAMKAEALQ